ncbi:MAG: hypothetical protein Ct9H300mP11_09540 [Chloroflexota bacterium]|nr:MAG: hypothetical protein Ct9H300mP11_09540 [Chloroflexota bacterium]
MEKRVGFTNQCKWIDSKIYIPGSQSFPYHPRRKKSSMAEYKTSSTTLFRRCTSSTKSTSPACRLVNIAAMSPARSTAGPDVTLISSPSQPLLYLRV